MEKKFKIKKIIRKKLKNMLVGQETYKGHAKLQCIHRIAWNDFSIKQVLATRVNKFKMGVIWCISTIVFCWLILSRGHAILLFFNRSNFHFWVAFFSPQWACISNFWWFFHFATMCESVFFSFTNLLPGFTGIHLHLQLQLQNRINSSVCSSSHRCF